MKTPSLLSLLFAVMTATAFCQEQKLTILAGDGIPSYSGDGGPAVSARLHYPCDIAIDTQSNLYIADEGNSCIRKIDKSGTITTVAGNGTIGDSGDNGSATSAMLYSVRGVAIDKAGNLYIGDSKNNRVRKVDEGGTITTVAGTGVAGYSGDNGPATSAQLDTPSGIALDAAGNLYFADTYNNRIRKVSVGGTITTVAGTGVAGYSGDNGPATSARLYAPVGVAVDSVGDLYIADSSNNRIRKVSAGGIITTVAGTGVAGDSGDNGPATSARLDTPSGVALDTAGNLYVADTYSNRIRKVDTSGTITTVAGGPATSMQLSYPWSVVIDRVGNLYISDHDNHRIIKMPVP